MSVPASFDWRVARLAAARVQIAVEGVPVEYTASSGAVLQIKGIFVDRVEEPTAPGFVAELVVLAADIGEEPQRGDTVLYGQITYQVGDIVCEAATSEGRWLRLKSIDA